jgi:hypothetical protein
MHRGECRIADILVILENGNFKIRYRDDRITYEFTIAIDVHLQVAKRVKGFLLQRASMALDAQLQEMGKKAGSGQRRSDSFNRLLSVREQRIIISSRWMVDAGDVDVHCKLGYHHIYVVCCLRGISSIL